MRFPRLVLAAHGRDGAVRARVRQVEQGGNPDQAGRTRDRRGIGARLDLPAPASRVRPELPRRVVRRHAARRFACDGDGSRCDVRQVRARHTEAGECDGAWHGAVVRSRRTRLGCGGHRHGCRRRNRRPGDCATGQVGALSRARQVARSGSRGDARATFRMGRRHRVGAQSRLVARAVDPEVRPAPGAGSSADWLGHRRFDVGVRHGHGPAAARRFHAAPPSSRWLQNPRCPKPGRSTTTSSRPSTSAPNSSFACVARSIRWARVAARCCRRPSRPRARRRCRARSPIAACTHIESPTPRIASRAARAAPPCCARASAATTRRACACVRPCSNTARNCSPAAAW